MHLRGSIFYLVLVFTLTQCASPKPISGGPSDETPPKIIEEESTPNRQTNFHENHIVLVFDEWIVLNDINNQLVISPPMPGQPEVKQKGKGIILELPDSLREETTYTINFGSAIADLNEGNAIENYVFVFSTGSVLDSINIKGTVIDAITLKPVDNTWVMLYKTGEDSAVYNRKPDYLAKTNETGSWSISFLPEDSFDVVALKDENVNFLYDQEAEYFGWLSSSVFTGDSLDELPPIYVFPREKRTIIKEVVHYVPGWLKIAIDAPVPKPTPSLFPPLDSSISLWQGDTLHVWYQPENNYEGYVVLDNDTTQIRASNSPSVMNRPLLIRPTTGRLKPGGRATFTLNVPIAQIKSDLIVLQHDTLGIIPLAVERDTHDIRKFSVGGSWIGNNRYAILFLPGAITDFWGRTNDTIRESIVVSNPDQFGDLFISIEGLDSAQQYVVLLKEGEQIIDTFVVEEKKETRLVRRGLQPSAYVIEIIEDRNRNGVWDTGQYESRRQPEKKLIFSPEKLRAGWEQEAKLIWQ